VRSGVRCPFADWHPPATTTPCPLCFRCLLSPGCDGQIDFSRCPASPAPRLSAESLLPAAIGCSIGCRARPVVPIGPFGQASKWVPPPTRRRKTRHADVVAYLGGEAFEANGFAHEDHIPADQAVPVPCAVAEPPHPHQHGDHIRQVTRSKQAMHVEDGLGRRT
jgi:hypothetical protein